MKETYIKIQLFGESMNAQNKRYNKEKKHFCTQHTKIDSEKYKNTSTPSDKRNPLNTKLIHKAIVE